MKNVRLSRYYLLLCLPVFLALVGLVWGQPVDPPKPTFGLYSLFGRYVSAETAYDVSTVHDAGNGNVGSPVFFAGTSLMLADGKGNVCGESDGFYGGTPPPGVNLGPSYFHGTYTVDPHGRVTINTCSDTAFCANLGACVTDGTKLYKTQVGYLQSFFGYTVTTVEQINNSDSSKGGCCATTGFLVHSRVWSKGM